MRPSVPLPAALRDRPFTLREADAFGIPRGRLRRSDVATPARGVRVVQTESSGMQRDRKKPRRGKPWKRAERELLRRALVEQARLADGAALSHVTAGVIHGFPFRLARIRDAPTHITTYSDLARRRHTGVVVHPLPRDGRRVWVDGFVVTPPVDTWCALSALLSLDELIEIGDHLIRRQSPDATIEQLRAAVLRYAGRKGAKRLRAALELVRPRTDSVRETRLRLTLIRAGLPEPAVNASVRDAAGRHIKLGDLVYEDHRVLVEYDGEQHRRDSAQYHKDARDLERAAAAGWLVIRVRKHDRDPAGVARRVRAALRSRGARV